MPKFLHQHYLRTALATGTLAKISSFLGNVRKRETRPRRDIKSEMSTLTLEGGVYFEYNFEDKFEDTLEYENDPDDDDENSVQITAVLDPLSESAQRLSPLLILIRDTLQLPLVVLLAPKTEINSYDQLPIMSFYRFVANPLVPRAIFTDLPLEHVLTLRLDVPDSFDVSKKAATIDTDAMRCTDDVECEREIIVEYEINNFIVQGRCYEDATSVPPNGLQLVLNDRGGRVASDTIVMQNLGYFQLRTKPSIKFVNIKVGSYGEGAFEPVDRPVFVYSYVGNNEMLEIRRREGQALTDITGNGSESANDDDDDDDDGETIVGGSC